MGSIESSENTELHAKFLQLIKGTRIGEHGALVVNILYSNDYDDYDGTGTERCMLYDITKPGGNFLGDLKERMNDTDYNMVEATEKNLLIKDQQDFYCAIVQQTLLHPDSIVMEIFLSNGGEEDSVLWTKEDDDAFYNALQQEEEEEEEEAEAGDED